MGAAGFKPWVTGASEVASQLFPRKDDGDGFTGVFFQGPLIPSDRLA